MISQGRNAVGSRVRAFYEDCSFPGYEEFETPIDLAEKLFRRLDSLKKNGNYRLLFSHLLAYVRPWGPSLVLLLNEKLLLPHGDEWLVVLCDGKKFNPYWFYDSYSEALHTFNNVEGS